MKVDLGIPEELWDEPSAEVGELKSQVCTFVYFSANKNGIVNIDVILFV